MRPPRASFKIDAASARIVEIDRAPRDPHKSKADARRIPIACERHDPRINGLESRSRESRLGQAMEIPQCRR
jgi:hypothetical protein